MRKLLRISALALLGTVIVASIISERGRPESRDGPLLAGANVPAGVRRTIDRACRDCHSEATRYPWYSHIAPVSWLIDRDIQRGRERLNLSLWGEYSLVRRERFLSEIANQVQDGGMPLAVYTLMHRDARLSQTDVDAIFRWTQAERTRLILQSMDTSPK